MKLALINASPRGKSSNSGKLLKWLARDLAPGDKAVTALAVKAEDQPKAIERIASCDAYAIAFPLYTDAMPGIAKKFFERMMENKKSFTGKPVLFIIHSGFPEAAQSRMVERYVRHFAALMDMPVSGVVIIGGSEAMRFAPEEAFGKRSNALAALGKKFTEGQKLVAEDCTMPGHREKLPRGVMALFNLFAPLTDVFWRRLLKANNAFEKRFDKPYQ